MNDKTIFAALRLPLFSGAALALCLANPSLAGEVVLYDETPAWIEQADLETAQFENGPSQLIADWQHWLEDGVVTSYADSATRIDNPQALMEQGTISLSWLPDKGDLTIHRVEILRGGESIDLIEEGAQFDVLRREQGLEQRLLDGRLTATLAVPGLQVGDVLRVAHSVTIADQALGDEMQVLQFLGSKPWQVGFARAIVSWPEDEDVFWRVEDHAGLSAPITEGGVRKLEVELPLAELPDMPNDAPWRFRRNPVLRVGTYADWQELSRTMAPHFNEAAEIASDGDVAAQARAIMAKTDDPLQRAAFATQLVQDEVSYLLNGLDGGNYLPQVAEETWAKRYGDCKAKSVLLHALLKEMGIESQTVLVQTRGGDAIPELLPLPGNFDHMIVRAQIDGESYWLDGTSTATRIANIGWVPPFQYALPLSAGGSDLVEISQREQSSPNLVMNVVTDYTAGIDLPALFTLEIKFYGPQGADFRKLVDEGEDETLRQIGKSFAESQGGGAVSSVSIEYDEEQAFGTLHVAGVTSSDFEWKEGRLVLEPDMKPDAAFDTSRAKPEWRDIPVVTAGPVRNQIVGEMILPNGMEDFVFEGPDKVDATYANTRVIAANLLDGNRFSGKVEVVQRLGEIAPDQLPEVKRAVRRFASQEAKLLAPENMVWRWQLDRGDLDQRSMPILEGFAAAIDFAEDDDYGPLRERAAFLHDIYRFEDTLADLDVLVEKDTSAWVLQWRSNVLYSLGRIEASLADLKRAYDLEPDNDIALTLGERLGYAGRAEEALELLESLPVSDEESAYFAGTYATVTGLSGDVAGGLAIMAEEVAAKPQNETALNSDCWYRGLFDTGLDGALEICTRAIERASNSAPMLDSRAMVHYRMGNLAEALADLNSALELNPGLAASHYLRGIIRLQQGDKAGREDIAIALRIAPEIEAQYARHGLTVD